MEKIMLEKEIIKQMGSMDRFMVSSTSTTKTYEVQVQEFGKIFCYTEIEDNTYKFFLQFTNSDDIEYILYDKTCNTNVENIQNQIYSIDEAKISLYETHFKAMEYEFMKCILYKFLNFKYKDDLSDSFILNYIRSSYKESKKRLPFEENLGVLMFDEQRVSSNSSLKAYSIDDSGNYYEPYGFKEYNIELLSEINKKEKIWNISFNDFPYEVYSGDELKDKEISSYKKLGDLCFNISVYCFDLLEKEFKCITKYYMISIF